MTKYQEIYERNEERIKAYEEACVRYMDSVKRSGEEAMLEYDKAREEARDIAEELDRILHDEYAHVPFLETRVRARDAFWDLVDGRVREALEHQ